MTRRSSLHPLEVASILHDAGAPDHLVAAGVLHDTIEKTAVTASALRRRFGRGVASLVLAVTEDARIEGYAKRKTALRQQAANAGNEALMLFTADKTAKVRELRLSVVAPPKRCVAHYHRSLQLLEELLPDSPPTTHSIRNSHGYLTQPEASRSTPARADVACE